MSPDYEEPRPITRAQWEQVLVDGTEADLCDALVGLTFHEPGLEYVRDACLHLLHAESWQVRAVAATCLGHLARVHGRLDSSEVLPALRTLLDDPRTRGAAENAIDDIEFFVPET